MKKVLSLTLCILAFSSFSQTPRIKDDPKQRQEFELRKLRNPKTGLIPANIRNLELEFAKSLNARSRTSFDENTTWEHRGPFNVGGRTRALAVDVNDENIVLAGGVSGGLWRSINQGGTWLKVTVPSDIQSITCIAQDPRDGHTDTWYYGTGEFSGNSASGAGAFFLGDGIYKSTDGGVSWSVLSATEAGSPESFDSVFEVNNEIIVNPINGDLLVANFLGIYRSQNGGTSFSLVLDNTLEGWSDILTTSDGTLFSYLEGSGVFKSTDNGDNWVDVTDPSFPLSNGNRGVLAVAPSNENILYLLAEDGFDEVNDREIPAFWKFDDSDDSWTNLSENMPVFGGDVGDFNSQGGYNMIVEVKPDDENFVIIGGTNLYRSTDGFTTSENTAWVGGYSTLNNVSLYTDQHPDQHAFIFLSGNTALSGNDGGVQVTFDISDDVANSDGETVDWTWLNNGYLTTQVYALSTGPGNQIMAGFQDNSTWLTTSEDGLADWSDQLSGDGAYNDFNSNGTIRYMSAQNAQIFRVTYPSADSQTPTGFTRMDPEASLGYPDRETDFPLFITPFYLDPANKEMFYLAGDESLFVNTQASTSNRSVGWKSISLGGAGVISEFGLTRANMVYVGTDVGRLFRVEDPASSTPTVTEVTGSEFPSGSYISSIGVNTLDEDELVVTFSNYGVVSIFYSTDGGTSWTNISGNLEENLDGSGSGPSVRSVRILGDGRRYYIGTSTGLYSATEIDGANTNWVQEGASSIGNIVINHMVTRDDGQVVVGTHGNGLYSATVIPDVDISVTSLEQPGTMVFTELSNVEVTITNNARLATSPFDISLSVDGNLIVTDNIATPINESESLSHTFSAQVDLTAPGSYILDVAVSLIGDVTPSNDQLRSTIVSLAAPTDISLSSNLIDESQSIGTEIGTLTTSDLDDTSHSYSLVEGEGGDDNSAFVVSTSKVFSTQVFDFETKPLYTIRIQTEDDDGNTYAESFSIEVTDVTGLESADNLGITMYPNPFKNKLNLEMVNDYVGIIQIAVLSLDGKEVLIEKTYNKRQRDTRSLLDLGKLPSGNYLIKFDFGGKEVVGKLIKE